MAKRALCIGINDYPGTDSDLSGCVNDAQDWGQLLESKGFHIASLTDSEATKAAMKESIQSLIFGAERGDTVVLSYSGHGTWVPDRDGDERDGRDEALCPHDIATVGALTDDELYDVFDERERGVRFIFISDSCHSGSVSRFAPRPEVAEDVRAPRIRFLPPHRFLDADDLRVADTLARRGSWGVRRPHRGVLMSGCMDHEYSYDAWFGGRPNGAFTHVAQKTIAELAADATYRDWHKAIRQYLPSPNYPQSPKIQGSSRQRGWSLFE